jgi:hypothetical protein
VKKVQSEKIKLGELYVLYISVKLGIFQLTSCTGWMVKSSIGKYFVRLIF